MDLLVAFRNAGLTVTGFNIHAPTFDDYVYPYFEDIHERYIEEIYRFGLR